MLHALVDEASDGVGTTRAFARLLATGNVLCLSPHMKEAMCDGVPTDVRLFTMTTRSGRRAYRKSVRVTERTRCSSNITVMSISTLVLFTLLSYSDVVHSACVYTHPSGYSLRWLVLGDNVLFKLENSNVSVNEYTGVGFGENSGRSMDRINQWQLNSSGVNVFELASLRMSSQLRACDNGSLITLSRRYRNRNVQAEFARPIVTNSSDLNMCQTWNFITTPTKVGDGSYYVNSTNSNSVQVCNIAEECDVLKMMNAMTITTSPVPDRSEPRLFGQPKVVRVC
ncbi:hypothetical protein OSTOST_19838, partial [Ostertagia ostertagi]